jgi:hypothetical protein
MAKDKLYYDTTGTTFKEAFAEARGDGKKTFEWNGTKYTTELEAPKSKAKAAEPKSEAKEEASEPKEKEEKESSPVARTRAGTKVPEADLSAGPKNTFLTKERSDAASSAMSRGFKKPKLPDDVSAGPKNTFLTKERSDAASSAMSRGFKKPDINFSTDKKSVDETRIRSAGMSSKANSNVHGMKKGGSVKSSASSRGDGIAQRGKTKGRII